MTSPENNPVQKSHEASSNPVAQAFQPAGSGDFTVASSSSTKTIAALFLFLITLFTFLPAIHNGFLTYDDPEYVAANPYVKSGLTWAGVKWAFSAHGANWHPLTWLSHMLDGQIFGLKPWGHHLVNILFHALNTALVFLVFRRLTGNLGRSFVVALLFGLHPLRVESVAWVAERKDVLSGFFWLLTIWAYARFTQTFANKSRNPWLFYSLALIFFAFGLMSKSMLVTLPCVLLLLDYWPLQRYRSKTSAALFLEKIPFFFLTAAFSLTAYIAQKNGAGLVSTLSLNSRIANALISYCRYLEKILWPANLAALYPYPDHWPLLIVFSSAALLLIISIVFIALRRTQPFLLVGWLWFLGTMIPVIGLIQIGAQSMADRYTYIPSLGILVALVWGCGALVPRCQCQKFACGAVGIIALICLLLSRQQITYWKDTQALFQRSVDVTTDNTLALVGLGACLADEGKTDDAIQLYRRAIQISPHYYESHYNLGMALARQGHTDEAITEFRAALQDRPGVADAYINLGAAFAAKNNPAEAITQFQEAAHLNPSGPLPHDNLAILFANQNRFDEAITELQQALPLQPNNASRCLHLGEMMMQKNRIDEAIVQFQHALKLEPQNADAHNDLGTAFGSQGHLDLAIPEFRAAVQSNPDHPRAKINLAKAQQMLEAQKNSQSVK